MARITLPGAQAGAYSIGGVFFRDGVAEADQLTIKQRYLVEELLGATIDGDVGTVPPPSQTAEAPQPEQEPQPRSTAEDLANAGAPQAATSPADLASTDTATTASTDGSTAPSEEQAQTDPAGRHSAGDTAPTATDSPALPDSTVDASSSDGTTVPASGGDDTATV